MALLASIDIADDGSLKIERFADVLVGLGATVKRTSEDVKKDSKGTTDALTKLIQETRNYQMEVAKQSRTMTEVAQIMKAGTVITSQHTEAMKILNAQVQASTVLSTKHKAEMAGLVNSFKEGSTVTAAMAGNLQSLAANHQKAAGAALGQSSSMKNLNTTVLGLVQALGAAGLAYWTKNYIEQAFEIAARNQVLSTSMGVVAKNTGYTSIGFETQAAAIRKLGITTKESREAVLSFAQAELSMADTVKVARAAQDLAAIAGKNSSEAFGTLKAAIETTNPQLLRQFGIMQNLNTLYAKTAQGLGKNVDALSTFDKRQAIVNLILEQASKVSGAYEATMNDVGKAMASTKRYQEELSNNIGKAFLPAMKALVDIENEFLGTMAKMDPVLLAFLAGVIASVAGVASLIAGLRTLIIVLNLSGIAAKGLQASMGWIGLIGLAIGLATSAWLAYHAAQKKVTEVSTETVAAVAAQSDEFERLIKAVGEASEKLKKARESGDGVALAQTKLQETVNSLNAKYPGMIQNVDLMTGAYDLNAEALKRVRAEMQGLLDDQSKIGFKNLEDARERQRNMQRLFDLGQKAESYDPRDRSEEAALARKRASEKAAALGFDDLAGTWRQAGPKGWQGKATEEQWDAIRKNIVQARVAADKFKETLDAIDAVKNPVLNSPKRVTAELGGLDDPKLLDQALAKTGTTIAGLSKMVDPELSTALGKVKSAYEALEKNSAKWQAAYKSAYEQFTQTNATAGAQMEAANAALKDSKGDQEEYISRLIRMEGVLKSLEKMSAGDQAKFPELVDANEIKQIGDLLPQLDMYRDKAQDTFNSISLSMHEMFTNMAVESENALRKSAQDLEDMQRNYSRTTESMSEDLDDKINDFTMQGVDRRILENNRYFRDFARKIEDEIMLIKRRQKEEQIALDQKTRQDLDSLNRTITNAEMEFRVKKAALDRYQQYERAYEMRKAGFSAEDVEREIHDIEVGFDKSMETIRAQYTEQIKLSHDAQQKMLDDKKVIDEQYIKNQQDLLVKVEAVHQETNARIIKSSNFAWNTINFGVKSFVTNFLSGVGKMGDAMGSFRDLSEQMWKQIVGTASKAVQQITDALFDGLMGIGTKKGGMSGIKDSLNGLLGHPAVASVVAPLLSTMNFAPGQGPGGLPITTGWYNQLPAPPPVAGAQGSILHPQMGNAARFGGGAMMAGAGAYGLYQGVKAGSYGQSIMGGLQAGAGIGTMIMPGIGTIIGAGVGALGGALANLFGGGKGKKTNDARDEYKNSMGGVQALQEKVEKANSTGVGAAYYALNTAKTVEEVTAAVADLTKAFEAADKAATLKEAQDALKKTKDGLNENYAAMLTLRKQAQLVGFDMKRLYDAETIEDFNAAQADLNKLLETQQKRVDGLGIAMGGVAQRIAGLGLNLKKETDKILGGMDKDVRRRFERDYEIAQENGFKGGIAQYALTTDRAPKDVRKEFAESREKAKLTFGSVSASTTGTFLQIYKESGNLATALQAAEGPMKDLVAIQEEWGFAADSSFAALKHIYQTLKDNEDVATSVSGITTELKGLGDVGLLTERRFQDLGQEASRQLDILKDRGVGLDDQMVIMQPTLQALYEAQQQFGFATDDATQKLIDMGVANGTVGDQFKDTQSKMLDVLMAIGDALGADIPEAYRKFKDKVKSSSGEAETAANDLGSAVGPDLRDQLDLSKAAVGVFCQGVKTDAGKAELACKDVQDAVGFDLRYQLDLSALAISEWARQAKEDFDKVGGAATAISLGHSPGGLKEIPIQVDRSVPAIQRLHRQISTLEDAYGTTTNTAARLGYAVADSDAASRTSEGGTTVIFSPQISVSAMDGEELHDTLTNRTMPKMMEIFESGVGQHRTRLTKIVNTAPRRR